VPWMVLVPDFIPIEPSLPSIHLLPLGSAPY
jgi:hypothetical protein